VDTLRTLFLFLSDCLFPPCEDELRVRELSLEKLHRLLSISIYKGVHILYIYRDPYIKSALWQLKYHDDRRVADLLGKMLRKILLDEIATPHLLLPIPLAPQRFRERGYNQVTRIAIPAVHNHLSITIATHLLERRHHTSSQTRLGKHARRKNLAGAFQVSDPHQIQGVDILLLDDVVTTGSTLHHARVALMEAGAKSVTMIAIAH